MFRAGRIAVAGHDVAWVAALCVPGRFELTEEAYANAALIAAAPDLLAALMALTSVPLLSLDATREKFETALVGTDLALAKALNGVPL
jgi:hypothetical protein